MADDILGRQLENLFNLPPGSMNTVPPAEMTEVLVDGVKNKSLSLKKQLKETETLAHMSTADLVKSGISLSELESDKLMIRTESFEVYRVGKALLMKLYDDLKNQIGVNDRMYTAASKMLDSVNNSLVRLNEMNMKLRQEEEFKAITSNADSPDNKTKPMSPDQWIAWVDAVKEDTPPPAIESNRKIKDAEIQ